MDTSMPPRNAILPRWHGRDSLTHHVARLLVCVGQEWQGRPDPTRDPRRTCGEAKTKGGTQNGNPVPRTAGTPWVARLPHSAHRINREAAHGIRREARGRGGCCQARRRVGHSATAIAPHRQRRVDSVANALL